MIIINKSFLDSTVQGEPPAGCISTCPWKEVTDHEMMNCNIKSSPYEGPSIIIRNDNNNNK